MDFDKNGVLWSVFYLIYFFDVFGSSLDTWAAPVKRLTKFILIYQYFALYQMLAAEK